MRAKASSRPAELVAQFSGPDVTMLAPELQLCGATNRRPSDTLT